MDALDANLIVRTLLNDDEAQVAVVTRILTDAHARGVRLFVPLTVLLEVAWVVRKVARLSRRDLAEIMRELVTANDLEVEHGERFLRALDRFEVGHADLADYIHLESALDRDCRGMFTFDRALAKERGAILAS